jgi:hypothetical protein
MTLGSSMVGYCSLTLTLDLLTWTEIGSEVKKMMTTWTEVGVFCCRILAQNIAKDILQIMFEKPGLSCKMHLPGSYSE